MILIDFILKKSDTIIYLTNMDLLQLNQEEKAKVEHLVSLVPTVQEVEAHEKVVKFLEDENAKLVHPDIKDLLASLAPKESLQNSEQKQELDILQEHSNEQHNEQQENNLDLTHKDFGINLERPKLKKYHRFNKDEIENLRLRLRQFKKPPCIHLNSYQSSKSSAKEALEEYASSEVGFVTEPCTRSNSPLHDESCIFLKEVIDE